MKIEYYACSMKVGERVRWRIRNDDGKIIAKGQTGHMTKEQCQYELNEVVEFIEAVSRGRDLYGGE